jgi:hypothetical protein
MTMRLYLPRNLAGLAQLVGDNSGRTALHAVRVRDPGGGRYRAEATDGRLIAVVQGPIPVAAYPALDEAHDAGGAEALVAKDDWKRAFGLGDRRRPVGLAADPEGGLTLAVGDQALTARACDGRYPDVDAVLPRHGPLVAVRLDPSLLGGLLKLAAVIKPDGGVDLLFFGPGKPLGLMTRNDSGQTLDCLLMPLT